ncbi:MAG: hypothetical protein PHD70_10145 [Anaerostipes sp.]|nr:hypothetical protein [Anaerostipes sp.]MDD3746817.1 hypothetical protein [Anaerostipes sp.]
MRFGIISCKMQGHVDEHIWNGFVDPSIGTKEAKVERMELKGDSYD